MKFALTTSQSHSGLALAETMIAAAIGSAIIGAMVLGSVAFQTLSNGANEHYRATGDQIRVLDSIALDMRRTTSGTVSNNGRTLSLNLPDYFDYSLNPPAPRVPSISKKGVVTYGGAGNQPTITYTVAGSAPNQTITRTEASSLGTTSSTLTWNTAVISFFVRSGESVQHRSFFLRRRESAFIRYRTNHISAEVQPDQSLHGEDRHAGCHHCVFEKS